MAIENYVSSSGGQLAVMIIIPVIIIISFIMCFHSYFVVCFRKGLEKKRVKYTLVFLALANISIQTFTINFMFFSLFITNDYPSGVAGGFQGLQRILIILTFIHRLTTTFDSTAFVLSQFSRVYLYVMVVILIIIQIANDIANGSGETATASSIATIFVLLENITSISILYLFAKRLFILMRMCANDNVDLDYKSSMILTHSSNVSDQMTEQMSVSNITITNPQTDPNATGAAAAAPAGEGINLEKSNSSGNVSGKKKLLNEDQIEYLHLLTRLTLVNFIIILSGQLLLWLSTVFCLGGKDCLNNDRNLFPVILLSIFDLFVDQSCVYFAFSFSVDSYQKICACGHYIVYQMCVSCVYCSHRGPAPVEPQSTTI